MFLVLAPIMVAAALLPALGLMFFIYKKDSIEKEPVGLLVKLAFLGVLSGFLAMIPEEILDAVLNLFMREGGVKSIVAAFIGVACVEEGTKFVMLMLGAWRNKNFDYKFDGVVYSVFVGLGFAAIENILYVFQFGLSVAPSRALLSIPGHMSFAVFMGLYLGKAKVCEAAGNMKGKKQNLLKAYFFPVLFHGIYDSCLMIGTTPALLIFIVFVIAFYIVVFKKIKFEAATDCLINPQQSRGFFNYMFTGAVVRGGNYNDNIPNDPNYTSYEKPDDIKVEHRYVSNEMPGQNMNNTQNIPGQNMNNAQGMSDQNSQNMQNK